MKKYKKQQIEKKISLHVGKFLDYREFLIFSPLDLAKLLISFSAGTVFNVFWEAYKPQCLSADFFWRYSQ